jgi:hypothetical protein
MNSRSLDALILLNALNRRRAPPQACNISIPA